MAYSIDHYPGGLPEFISTNPAPREWQRRVQAIDPDLWIAWNPYYQDGERWSIVRFAGHNGFGRGAVPLIARAQDGADPYMKAMFGGWSFVRSLDNPDGTAADLTDMAILNLFRDDYWRKYGRGNGEAAERLIAERREVKERSDATHRGLMSDAWKDTMADKAITAGATSVVMPGGA